MRLFSRALLLLSLFCVPAQFLIANPAACNHDEQSFRCVEYVDNYDGDTIKFNIPGIHPLLGKKILIRVRGIDAPEVRSKDSCEKDMAIYVRNHLRDLLVNAKQIDLINIERDKYFRIVAEVKIDRLLVGEYLLSQGFATAYDGAKKPRVNWCEPWDQINFPDQSFTMAP